MVLLEQMKNLKIYKRQMYLPTLEKDKKNGAAILLLSPNYETSLKLMNHPMTVNRLRYRSYYIQKDPIYYINGSLAKNVQLDEYVYDQNEYQMYQSLLEMKAAERNALQDKTFGLPSKRKYPLNDEKHVRSAIKFFNYVSKEDEAELARNIKKAIKKYGIKVSVGDNNRLKNYIKEDTEILTESTIEDAISTLSEYVSYSGFYNDIEVVKSIVTPGLILHALKESKYKDSLNSPNDIPKIHIIVVDEIYEEDKDNNIFIESYNKKLSTGMKDYDYIRYVESKIYNVYNCSKYDYINDNISLVSESTTMYNSELEESLDAFEENDFFKVNNVMVFLSEGKYDTQLRKYLYKDRLRTRKQVIELLSKVKADNPWITFAFPEIEKLRGKNVFIDLYYYTQLFFQYNNWKMQRGYDLFFEFFERLINDPRISKAGYKKKTIFMPITEWNIDKSKTMWMFRTGINPISIIYNEMLKDSPRIKKLFKGITIVFFSNSNRYFKINFDEIEDLKKASNTFRRFIRIIANNEEFEPDDIDTSMDNNETKEVIKQGMIDKIEKDTGVDLTGKERIVIPPPKTGKYKAVPVAYDANDIQKKDVESSVNKKVEADKKKGNLTQTVDNKKIVDNEKNMQDLADHIDDIASASLNIDDAISRMEDINQDEIKMMLLDIDSASDDSVKIDSSRAARMNKLNDQFLKSTVKGKTVEELLKDKKTNQELDVTDLEIGTVNEEWKNLTYINFDKDYDLNRDIVACFEHFTHTSKPISIRKFEVKDNSTSEDRLDLYIVECEDFRGKRFTIKVDIPRMVDNRMLLRGNSKSIQTQFFNMPILKTGPDACQIISNYQKVFVYRVNDITGRSNARTSRFIKALSKYEGKDIKVTTGDNSLICNKYELPVDYIDISTKYSKIETDEFIIYFNQEEVEKTYPNVDYTKGTPIAYSKKNKEIIYYTMDKYSNLAMILIGMINNKKLTELFYDATPSKTGMYSRCNIMNEKIPMIILLGYWEGLNAVLKKAGIEYTLKEKLTNEEKKRIDYDYIRFSDGYLYYEDNYSASMLLSGLKQVTTETVSFTAMDDKSPYLEFLDNYGGRIKSDGLDNFYDCMLDPITVEILNYYNLPTDLVKLFLYANNLLCDNKYTKHTDTTSRRIRRQELIAAYTYEALSEAYGSYSNMIKHGRGAAEFTLKQDAVINKIIETSITSDDSIMNPLYSIETTNSITFKGKAGLNSDRSYSLDKRIYDDSMLNVLGASTGFSGNVGITRQATIDMNIEGARGYIKSIDGNIDKLNAAKTLCATEAVTPFGSTRDDAQRTYMTFLQTAKHTMKTTESDPLLITNGADEAIPYLTIDKFATKAKYNGKIIEVTEDYMIIDYGTDKEYINLKETVEKNSDAGFYVPLKLTKYPGLSVGSKVKKGQIVAYDAESFSSNIGEDNNLAYNIGKLTKVAIINTDEGFEDSGFCTERLSKALGTKIIYKEEGVIDQDSNVFSIVKIGDNVEVDDPLIIWTNPHEDEEANTFIRIMGDNSDQISELGRRTIKADRTGVIKDIKIYRTCEIEKMSPSLQKIVKNYEAPIKQLKKKLDSLGIPSSDLPATYKLAPTGKLKKAQDAIYIEFYIEVLDVLALGDKMTYFAANKAVIKNIIPEEDYPYTDFRPDEPIDAFVSQLSISKRLVNSIPINGAINKLLIELDRSCKDMLGIKYDTRTL